MCLLKTQVEGNGILWWGLPSSLNCMLRDEDRNTCLANENIIFVSRNIKMI